MKVGLLDVDSKIPNLALMKASNYHKRKNDQVEFFNPMFTYDIVYQSKVFGFTPNYKYQINADKIYKGGSGINLDRKLIKKIENSRPDYDLYPPNYAMGFTTRGCIRNCEFCIVPEKEGKIRATNDIYDFWDGQEYLKLLDNNLTAHNKQYEKILKQLAKENIKVDFSQGLDIRLITPNKAKLLSKVKLWKQIHFAFDNMKDEKAVRKGIKTLTENGVKAYKLMFYVLIGFNTTEEEDLYRVELLRDLSVDPFVMPYDKSDSYQKNFARWVNHKAVWKSVSWEDYKKS